MRVKVLGSAAGGGFPQWNCGCSNCTRLRAGTLKGLPRTQAQVAVSPAPGYWILLNASPDLRQQLSANLEFAPLERTRSTPIVAIVLTGAEPDCVMGLLHLREFQPLKIYSTPSVRRALTEENKIFRVLERSHPPVSWEELPLEKTVALFRPVAGQTETALICRAVPLGGAFPDYVSDSLRAGLRQEEAVIALEIAQGAKRFFYAPSLPGAETGWRNYAGASELALLDGTFWTDDELTNVLANGKAARQSGHLPLSGAGGLLEKLRGAGAKRRALIHMNNTNPVLDDDSAASKAVRDAGWEIAYDGMEFDL